MEIILGDDATYPGKGVGNATLQLNEGSMIHLQESLYVHDLKKNLLSITATEVKGFYVAFIDAKGYMFEKGIFKMLFLLGSGLAICIKLKEVHWGPCQLTHLFYSIGGSAH